MKLLIPKQNKELPISPTDNRNWHYQQSLIKHRRSNPTNFATRLHQKSEEEFQWLCKDDSILLP